MAKLLSRRAVYQSHKDVCVCVCLDFNADSGRRKPEWRCLSPDKYLGRTIKDARPAAWWPQRETQFQGQCIEEKKVLAKDRAGEHEGQRIRMQFLVIMQKKLSKVT